MKFVFTTTLLVAFLGTCLSQGTPGQTLQSQSPQVPQVPQQPAPVPSQPPQLPQPSQPPQLPQEPKINPDDFRAELAKNRLKWKISGIDSYVIEERRSCFCPRESIGPFDVTVIQNRITDVQFSSSSGLTGTPDRRGLLTVLQAFQEIEDVLNRPTPVARLTVNYDAQLGYITDFFVDVSTFIADEERGSSFKLLRVLPKQPPVQPPKPPTFPGKANLELRRNRAKWNANGPKFYQYRLRRNCFCTPNFVGPFLVTVRNKQVTSAVFEGNQPPNQPPFPPPTDIPTIDGLFKIIDEALNGPNKAFSVDVDYDPVFGAPKRIAIDRIENAIDDEITYVVEFVRGFTRPHPNPFPRFPHFPSFPHSPNFNPFRFPFPFHRPFFG